ncbi:MAG: rRNA adenine N-6-methyltransferase family protein [Candidatus Brocadiaceae bacterium]
MFPYNISTPVIINLLEGDLPIFLMVLMLQSEITERLMAVPGTREYGILSILTRLFSDVQVMKKLSPESFWPRPDVHSALVKVCVNRERFAGRITDYHFFKKIIYAIFTSRRKTLLNSLEGLNLPGISRDCLKGIIRDMHLDERVRRGVGSGSINFLFSGYLYLLEISRHKCNMYNLPIYFLSGGEVCL